MFRIRAFIHRLLAVGAACIVRIACAAGAQDTSNLHYMDPELSPEERAADLVRRMQPEEKCSQLVNQARAIPCLGVAAYDWWSEVLHGVFANGITEFPEPIGLAATFDTPRVHEMATAIGIEGESSTCKTCAPDARTSLRAWISGHPTSISFAIRAGAVGKKLMAKIRS